MNKSFRGKGLILASLLAMSMGSSLAFAGESATVTALRMNGVLTGGTMPTSNPVFTTMVNDIAAGNLQGAAMAVINTPFFAAYLPRRMAKEMQNVNLTDVAVPDNDASTFILAHLLHGTSATNTGVSTGISTLFSDNVTCKLDIGGTPTPTFSATPAQLAAVNWTSQIQCSSGQTDGQGNAITASDVGGYATQSTAVGDGSYAQNAFTAGTNLRGIEYVYEIGMGLQLLQIASTVGATTALAPPFVPISDPNFFVGSGQPACISCHGGGVSNVLHGYATVADKFNYDPTKGFEYIATPATSTDKSLGSNASNRTTVLKCITNRAYPTGFSTCNPDSIGVSNEIAGGEGFNWDLTSWGQAGILGTMGWAGATTGSGLNSLGQAVGKASLVYQFMTQRVISEICPTGTVSAANVASYAAAGQAQDSFAAIVAGVATDPNCQ